MVVPDSHRVSRAPRYSGISSSKLGSCRLQGYHLLWLRFPADSTRDNESSLRSAVRKRKALQPHPCNACTLEHKDGLGCSPFARHYSGNLGDFFSSGYLDVSVPLVPLARLWIHRTILVHYHQWVAPFGDPRITACLRLPEAYRCWPRPSSAPGA